MSENDSTMPISGIFSKASRSDCHFFLVVCTKIVLLAPVLGEILVCDKLG